jgi:SAM-dependent methyltransferase
MSSSQSNVAGLETNPLRFFSKRGENYEKYRPIHPDSAIDTILLGLNPSQLVAADIGAGTGIGSRLLADRGVQVMAIEPNTDMRTAAKPHDKVKVVTGTAEQIPLETASVDLVVSFQAFHWFDFTKSLQEFQRILKPGGRLALIWSLWDQKDAVTRRYSNLISEVSKDKKRQAQSQMQAKMLLQTVRYQLFWRGLWLPGFRNFQRHWFFFDQYLDLAGLIGLAQSQGYVPHEGVALEKLILKLSELHSHYHDEQNRVRLAYCTRLYLAIS